MVSYNYVHQVLEESWGQNADVLIDSAKKFKRYDLLPRLGLDHKSVFYDQMLLVVFLMSSRKLRFKNEKNIMIMTFCTKFTSLFRELNLLLSFWL